MVEFRRKLENRGIKIAWVNSILISKSINLQLFTLILYVLGSVVMTSLNYPPVLSPFIGKSMIYLFDHVFIVFDHVLTRSSVYSHDFFYSLYFFYLFYSQL